MTSTTGAHGPGPNPSTALAAVLVDELTRGGIRDVVLCPGSRNAALSLALFDADAAGALRLHVRLDERGAGFLALGMARRSARVVAVVCTSGTAVANLHPAVLEASHAGVGLLVVSADRPTELVATGASQTVDQHAMFGGAVRASLTIPAAEHRAGEVARWRARTARAVVVAAGHATDHPGPVQLDVAFREPLTPAPAPPWPDPLDGRPDRAPWTDVGTCAHTLPELPLDPSAPTLVIAGDGTAGPLPVDVPAVAEPTAATWPQGLRAGPWLLAALAAGHVEDLRPSQVVVLGRPTLHRSVQALLSHPDVTVHAVPAAERAGAPEWVDTRASVRAVGALPPGLRGPRGFAHAWARADAVATEVLDGVLDEPGRLDEPGVLDGPDGLDGLRLARNLTAALPDGALLVAGPSNPIRDLALAARPRPGLWTVANRGVAGIDGVVSTALGAALAHDGGPAVGLLGDLTLLHDVTALSPGALERHPDLTLVVASDDGGSVFTLLEQGAAEHARAFERVFATPHGLDLGAVARAHGVAHVRLAGPAEVADALDRPVDGVRILEVPIDRRARRAAHRRLQQEIDGALDGALGGTRSPADAMGRSA